MGNMKIHEKIEEIKVSVYRMAVLPEDDEALEEANMHTQKIINLLDKIENILMEIPQTAEEMKRCQYLKHLKDKEISYSELCKNDFKFGSDLNVRDACKMVRDTITSLVLNPQMPRLSTVATHAKGDALPDFQILFYPVITMMPDITHKGSHDNFLGEKAKKRNEQEYSSDLQVTRVTPRAFIALSDDDHTVLPANGVNYYLQLYRNDVPATLHVYPSGGHGWGNRDSFKYHNEMQLDLKAWLRSF